MIILSVILSIIIIFGSAIFFANGAAALVIVKKENPNVLWPSWVLITGGICMLLLFSLGVIFWVEKIANTPDGPKYEIVTEQLYRQVN
jgi:DMSO reductase anchor subunit